MDVQRMIQQVFVREVTVHPLTFATAREMHCTGDTPLTVVACWWMAYKFEEVNMTMTVDDLVYMFPTIVDRDRNAEALRKTELMVLARQNFCMPYHTRMREVYNLLPSESAKKYHRWLAVLQDYNVLHIFSAPDWVHLLVPALEQTSMSTTLQLLALTFRRRHRQRLCPTTPRIAQKKADSLVRVTTGIRKKSRVLNTIHIIDPFK